MARLPDRHAISSDRGAAFSGWGQRHFERAVEDLVLVTEAKIDLVGGVVFSASAVPPAVQSAVGRRMVSNPFERDLSCLRKTPAVRLVDQGPAVRMGWR